MPIVPQGQSLPPYDSLSYEEEVRLFDSAATVVRRAGDKYTPEVVAVRSIGSQGDNRTYDATLFLVPRVGAEVSTKEAGELATRTINETNGIGRVFIDVTPHRNESGSS